MNTAKNTGKESKAPAVPTPTAILRENVQKSGIRLSTLAVRAKVPYDRLLYILKRGEPRLDEAVAVQNALRESVVVSPVIAGIEQ